MTNLSKFAAVATLVTAAIATSSAVMPSSAQAFSLAIDPRFGSTENTGSTAKLNFDFVQSGSSVLLNLGMINTTNGTVGLKATKSTLVGIAFDTPDMVSGVSLQSANGSAFTKLWKDVSLPPYAGTYDVGISTERNSFAGGNATKGLKAGESATVSFLFNTTLDAKALESAFLKGFTNGSLRAAGRFQQVDVGAGSDKVSGGIIQPPPVRKVPEPSALLGILTMGGVLLGHKKLQGKNKLTESV